MQPANPASMKARAGLAPFASVTAAIAAPRGKVPSMDRSGKSSTNKDRTALSATPTKTSPCNEPRSRTPTRACRNSVIDPGLFRGGGAVYLFRLGNERRRQNDAHLLGGVLIQVQLRALEGDYGNASRLLTLENFDQKFCRGIAQLA